MRVVRYDDFELRDACIADAQHRGIHACVSQADINGIMALAEISRLVYASNLQICDAW
jgi:hypothetical protein